MIYLYAVSFSVCLYVHFLCTKIRGWPVSVYSVLGFRFEIMERYQEGRGSCKRSFISVSKRGARLKMIFSLGQRSIIITHIESHCNLPKYNTHSYSFYNS